MKKLFLKTLMTALVLLTGGVSSAWAADALTASLKVAGYSTSHFFDFVNRDFDGTSYTSNDDLPGLGVTAQITVQEAYATNTWYYYNGLRNQAGGGRWIQFPAEIKADDYIIINGAAASEAYEISMTDGTSTTITGASDYLCFKANKDMSALKLTVHRYNYISQILIMTKDASASTADYTITYMYGSETVKTSTGNAVVGSSVVTDASFFVDDVKYFRADGEEESFAIEASGNEFTVDVRQAETYGYTLLSSLGTTISSGSGLEGETVSVGYPRYQLQETDLYEAGATNKEYRMPIALTENNATATVTYTKKYENVVFYAEAETLDGFTASTKDNIPARASNALAAVASEDVEITTLPIGKYVVHGGVFTSKSKDFESVNFGVGSETFVATLTAGNLNELASEEYALTSETAINYLGTTSWADAQFDYVWIEKTGDVEDPALTTAKEELLTVITYATSIEASELTDAISAAQAAYDAEDATAESVNDAKATLVLAVKQYAKGALQTVLELAEEMSGNSGELSADIQEFKDNLDTAIETAKAVLDDDTKTPDEIMTALNELSDAALVFASVTLEAAIEAAKAIDTEGKNGAEELAAAIAAAEAAFSVEDIQGFYQAGLDLKQAIDVFNAANEPVFDPSTVLKNPSFEYSAEGTASTAQALTNGGSYYGWTLPALGTSFVNISIGDASNCNGQAFGIPAAKDGNFYYFARRGWNGSSSADASLSTTMTALPVGHYTLTMAYKGLDSWDKDHNSKGSYLKLSAVEGDTELGAAQTDAFEAVNGNNAGANKFAGDANWLEVSLEFDVETEGDVTLDIVHHLVGGVRTDVVIDNLTLAYKSPEEAAAEALAKAKSALLTEIKQATSFETEDRPEGTADYDEAISQAQAVYNSSNATVTDLENATATLHTAELNYLTANQPVPSGTYYLYNPMLNKFLARGNAYGTAAVVADYGVAINVTTTVSTDAPDGLCSLVGFDNNASYGFDEWMYADAGGDNVRAYALGRGADGSGYTLTNTGNNKLVYVSLADDNMYRVAGNGVQDDNFYYSTQALWQFLTPADYNAKVAENEALYKSNAFAAAGIAEDAEVVVGEAVELTFASNNGWTQTVVRTENNQPATNANGTEMWQATGYYTQTVSDLPSGLYKVSIQAFYRNGGADDCVTRYNTGNNTVLAYLEVNESKAQVKSWATDKGDGNDPNNMDQAKAKFDAGKYLSETYAYVGEDGELNLTVYNPAFIGNGWFIVGNVKYAKVEVSTPDLAITNVEISGGNPYEMGSEGSCYLDYYFENRGNAAVNGYTVELYDGEEKIWSVDWDNKEVEAGGTGEGRFTLSTVFLTEDGAYMPGVYNLSVKIVCADDADETNNASEALAATLYVVGDANIDGEVSTGDAVATVSYALEKLVPSEIQQLSADINKSNTITVADAVGIVNLALNAGEPELLSDGARSTEPQVDYLTMNGTEIGLVNTTAFSGFQMDVTLSDGAVLGGAQLTERANGLTLTVSQLSADTWRIIALSLDATAISGNDGSLLSLDIVGQGSASVSRVEFADRAANAYELGFVTPTGISTLYNNKVKGEIYTVSGSRSGSLKKGINVVRQADGSVSKVLVK